MHHAQNGGSLQQHVLDLDDPLHFSWDTYGDAPSFIRSLGAVIHPDNITTSRHGLEEHVQDTVHSSSHPSSFGEVDGLSVQES